MAQKRLSYHSVLLSSSPCSVAPAFSANDIPAPTWMPLMIGTGMSSDTRANSPVTERSNTIVPTPIPAAMVSFKLSPRESDTAARAFIGCTYPGTRISLLLHPHESPNPRNASLPPSLFTYHKRDSK